MIASSGVAYPQRRTVANAALDGLVLRTCSNARQGRRKNRTSKVSRSLRRTTGLPYLAPSWYQEAIEGLVRDQFGFRHGRSGADHSWPFSNRLRQICSENVEIRLVRPELTLRTWWSSQIGTDRPHQKAKRYHRRSRSSGRSKAFSSRRRTRSSASSVHSRKPSSIEEDPSCRSHRRTIKTRMHCGHASSRG